MTAEPALLELYLAYRKDTEPPKMAHRWSLVSCVGALLGRKYYIQHGAFRVFPNCYIMLIGDPGARKSTAIKMAKKVLAASGYDKFNADKTTKEKFLLDLEGVVNDDDPQPTGRRKHGTSRSENFSPADVLESLDLAGNQELHDGVPREVFIVADEFNEFAGTGNLDFLSLLGTLWDWDDETACFKQRLKNSRSVAIYQPTISLLGGNTHTGLKEGLPPQSIGQGFMSRVLFVHTESSGRKITFPGEPSQELGAGITDYLGRIAREVEGASRITRPAEQALDTIYKTWQELEDTRFRHYSTRRFTHLLKLCLVASAMRLSVVIDLQDVVYANTLLTHTENSMSKALGEFGKSKNSEATQAVMTALYNASKPLKFEDLWKVVSRDLEKRDQLSDILMSLSQSGKIQPASKTRADGFLPVQRPIGSKALYVDQQLLMEFTKL